MEKAPDDKNKDLDLDKDLDEKEKSSGKSFSSFFKRDNKKEKKEAFHRSKKYLGVENIKENHGEIQNMATSLLSPKKVIESAKTENFRQAMERLGTTKAQLFKIHHNYLISFYISLTAFTFLLFFGVHNAVSSKGVIPVLAALSIALLCLANAFRFSFRCFQIKYQKLCSIKDFIDNREFIPFPLQSRKKDSK